MNRNRRVIGHQVMELKRNIEGKDVTICLFESSPGNIISLLMPLGVSMKQRTKYFIVYEENERTERLHLLFCMEATRLLSELTEVTKKRKIQHPAPIKLKNSKYNIPKKPIVLDLESENEFTKSIQL